MPENNANLSGRLLVLYERVFPQWLMAAVPWMFACGDAVWLEEIYRRLGAAAFYAEHRFDDAAWENARLRCAIAVVMTVRSANNVAACDKACEVLVRTLVGKPMDAAELDTAKCSLQGDQIAWGAVLGDPLLQLMKAAAPGRSRQDLVRAVLTAIELERSDFRIELLGQDADGELLVWFSNTTSTPVSIGIQAMRVGDSLFGDDYARWHFVISTKSGHKQTFVQDMRMPIRMSGTPRFNVGLPS